MIVFQDDGLLGDSIMALPALKALALANPGNAYLSMCNPHVRSLIPQRWGYKELHGPGNVPNATAHMVYRFGSGDVFARWGQHQKHPTAGFLELAGFPTTEWAVQPEIEFTIGAQPRYDYVISAISRANGKRMWPLEEWRKLLPQLSGSICMVGVSQDGRPFEDIDYFYDQPLQDVAAVCAKARCVITIDNGIGRLMHAIGNTHILLCSNVVGEVWGTYPGAHVIYDAPQAFGVERVLALARSLT